MLKINPDPTFSADVKLTVPGQSEPGTVSLTFKYRGRKELAEFWEANRDKNDAEIFPEIVVGWSGVDVEFSPDNLRRLLENYPAASLEIAMEYRRLLLESRLKN